MVALRSVEALGRPPLSLPVYVLNRDDPFREVVGHLILILEDKSVAFRLIRKTIGSVVKLVTRFNSTAVVVELLSIICRDVRHNGQLQQAAEWILKEQVEEDADKEDTYDIAKSKLQNFIELDEQTVW